jgi:hypothetical protein
VTDEGVRTVRLLCAGFTLGVLFMAAAAHWHFGTLCTGDGVTRIEQSVEFVSRGQG